MSDLFLYIFVLNIGRAGDLARTILRSDFEDLLEKSGGLQTWELVKILLCRGKCCDI